VFEYAPAGFRVGLWAGLTGGVGLLAVGLFSGRVQNFRNGVPTVEYDFRGAAAGK